MKRLAFLVLLGGCAKILGLDPTHFAPPIDASIDAPSVCDGLPAACTGDSTTRTICGQIVGTGATAAVPLRVATPTGLACGASSSTEGPCAMSVSALDMPSYFAGSGGTPIAGTIDDCGRYVISGIDATIPDVAVVFTSSQLVATTNLVDGLGSGAGTSIVGALAVGSDTEAAWKTELAGADVSTGFLVHYLADGQPLAMDSATTDGNGAFTNPAGTVPWAAYFGDDFGSFTAGATTTQSSGAAFVVPGPGSFQVAGVRTGRRCKLPPMQQVTGTLLVVTIDGC